MKQLLICLSALLLSACVGQSSWDADALSLSPKSMADRQLQTRRFETSNRQTMLRSSAAVLQDLGFTLDSTEPSLGILAASKRRDASTVMGNVGQTLDAVDTIFNIVSILSGQGGKLGGKDNAVDKDQLIRVSIVVREIASPAAKAKQSAVRATFQRTIFNTKDEATLAEQIKEPEVYREFFDKLSQAVFLEAHEI
jgi:hypothetical protein